MPHPRDVLSKHARSQSLVAVAREEEVGDFDVVEGERLKH